VEDEKPTVPAVLELSSPGRTSPCTGHGWLLDEGIVDRDTRRKLRHVEKISPLARLKLSPYVADIVPARFESSVEQRTKKGCAFFRNNLYIDKEARNGNDIESPILYRVTL
jgi:hypothetical protein